MLYYYTQFYEIKVVYACTYMPGGLTILVYTSYKRQWSMNYVFTITLLLDASSNICVTHMYLLYKDEKTYIISRTTNSFMCRDREKYETPNTK